MLRLICVFVAIYAMVTRAWRFKAATMVKMGRKRTPFSLKTQLEGGFFN